MESLNEFLKEKRYQYAITGINPNSILFLDLIELIEEDEKEKEDENFL
jgi:hypothetical protein